jgi:hypothetical protein
MAITAICNLLHEIAFEFREVSFLGVTLNTIGNIQINPKAKSDIRYNCYIFPKCF